MDELGLHLNITASAGSAVTAVSDLDSHLAKLAKAYESAGKGARVAGKEVEKATGVFGKLKSAFEGIEQHASKMGDVGNKLGGFGNAFKGLADKAGAFKGILGEIPGPAMAITGALAAVGGAAAFLNDSANKAAKFQQSMDVLGQTVKDSGANWASARRQVLAFADAQEKTTTYSRDDVVKALSQMTAAGMSYKDSMAEIRVAEDASAATGQDLTTVSHGLVEALHGRTQALTMLGIGTKQSIHQGMTLYQMNAAIEKQMGGSAQAAATGYAGSMTRLHHAFETLQENIGSAVLPVLSKLAETLFDLVESAESQFKKWENAAHAFYLRNKQAFDAIGAVIKAVWTGVEDITHVVWSSISGYVKSVFGVIADDVTFFSDLFTGHFDRLWGDVKNIFVDSWRNLTSGFGNFGQNLITIAERIAKAVGNIFAHMGKAMSDVMHLKFGAVGGDMSGAFSGFSGLTSGLHWNLGWGGHAAAAESNPLPHLSAAAGDTMAGGPMSGAKHAAHAAHHASKAAATARKAEAAAIREARQELQRYIATIDLEQKQHHITITQEISDLKRYEATHKLTAGERIKIEQKIEALEQQSARITQQAEHKKQLAIKATEAAEKRVEAERKRQAAQEQRELQKQQAAWHKYYAALEQNAQKWTSTTAGWIDKMFQHGKKGVNSFTAAFHNMLKELEQALLKSLLFKMFMGGQGAGGGASFGSLIAQNMGFGSKGGSAPAGGGLGMLAMGASMLGGHAGGALSGITSLLGGGKHGASANGTGGIIGALIGTSAASQLASSLPTDSLMSMMFGVGAPSAPGGLGAAAGSGGLGGAATVIAGASGPGGGTMFGGAMNALGGGKLGGSSIGSILGMHLGGPYVGATLGSVLLGAAGGYGIGSLIGNSGLFHGQNDANIGGAIGGGAGAFFGTALDAALGIGTGGLGLILGPLLGSIGGSLLGGLFGSHTSPATSPDIYNTSQFGQIVADLTGAGGSQYWSTDPTAPKNHTWFGANGQKFYNEYGAITGGGSMIGFIEQTLAQYAKPGTTQMGSNAPSWLAPLWNQLVSAFGVSATGSGQLQFGHNIGQEWVTGAAGASSNAVSYTQLGNLMDQFLQNFTTQGAVSWANGNEPGTNGIPNMNPNSNGGFNVFTPFAGSYVVGYPGSAPVLASGSGLPTFALNPDPLGGTTAAGAPAGLHGRHTMGSTIHVTVNVAGNVTAEDNLAETIREKIVEFETRRLSSLHMTLSGVGF